MRSSLRVTFGGEPGIDEGGLLTEMFTLFFDGVLQGDAEGGLFEGAEAAGRREVREMGGGAGAGGARAAEGDEEGGRTVSAVVLPAAVELAPARVLRLRAFGRAMVKGASFDSFLCVLLVLFFFAFFPHIQSFPAIFLQSSYNRLLIFLPL